MAALDVILFVAETVVVLALSAVIASFVYDILKGRY
jgi:hypothetical protein